MVVLNGSYEVPFGDYELVSDHALIFQLPVYLTYAREVSVRVLHSMTTLNQIADGSLANEISIQVSKPFTKLFGTGDLSKVLMKGLQHEIPIHGDGFSQALSY